MTSIAAQARAAAVHCEAKKHAYRQTQDGVVLSFVLHPQDMPEGLATAPLGTRYMLALVQIGDDETPVQQEEAPANLTTARPRPALPDSPAPGGRKFDELSPAQQAGILCADPCFGRFLIEKRLPYCAVDVATCVREHCGVDSRAHIESSSTAFRRWHDLVSDYRAWQRAPEFTG